MKLNPLYISLLIALVFVGCSKDHEEPDTVSDDAPMEVAARTSWQCGRTMGVTRAPITDPIGEIDGDKNSTLFPDAFYPDWLHITMKDGKVAASTIVNGSTRPEKLLIRKTFSDNDNYDPNHFIAYHDTYALTSYPSGTKSSRFPYSKSQVEKLTTEANTLSDRYNDGIPQAWDDQDIPTIGTIDHLTTKPVFGGSSEVSGSHLFLTLGHVTALLRLHFAVDAKYDRVRFIDLKNVTINDMSIVHEQHLILDKYKNHTLFGYAYVKPADGHDGSLISSTITGWGATATSGNTTYTPVTTSTSLTFKCTYDIYDKDPGFTYGHAYTDADMTAHADHRTRQDVIARNTVTLGKVGSTITAIKAGHYYDLYITINPDYLYVLSDHDNKHMTIRLSPHTQP